LFAYLHACFMAEFDDSRCSIIRGMPSSALFASLPGFAEQYIV
jgi:hypothetical protein